MGANGPFTVDHATLHNAANDVRNTRSEVDGELKKLSGLVGEIGSQWQGQAATAFQQLGQRWGEDTNKLLQALSDIADLLDKSGTQHSVNDEEQQSSMNSIMNALGG